MKLRDIADYVTDKISSDAIDLECYVTTDSLLQIRQVEKQPQICLRRHVPLHSFVRGMFSYPIYDHI